MTANSTRGRLILVVGPSGSGKDSLIEAARDHFTAAPDIVFPQRCITRDGNAGGEAHKPVSPEEFATIAGNGGFMLHWSAHGLHYGIPRSVEQDLSAGRVVIVNVSRSVLAFARRTYGATVISVSVRPDILEQRLRARGRETTEAEIRGRLDRANACQVADCDTIIIDNSAEIDVAAGLFIQVITEAQQALMRV